MSYPREFETISQIAGKLAQMVRYDLPKDYFSRFVQKIDRVSAADVVDAARRYISPIICCLSSWAMPRRSNREFGS